jgi:multidrug efflux pump
LRRNSSRAPAGDHGLRAAGDHRWAVRSLHVRRNAEHLQQIGLIILIALAAKNGILIVEFANQLRDEGRSIREAIIEASNLRIRPILMTSIATIVGALPLILGHGAGAESRFTIGTVIFFGLLVATMLTLFVVPVFYDMLAKYTKSPEATAKEIEDYEHGQAAARPAE